MEPRVEQPETDGSAAKPLWLDLAAREIEGLSRPGSVGFIAGDRADGLAVLHELGRVSGAAPVSITEVMVSCTPFHRWEELSERLAGCPLLYDLEAVCWDRRPGLDLLRFLRLHARKGGVVALWPGRIAEGIATFSVPGRRDYVRVVLTGLSVLASCSDSFP